MTSLFVLAMTPASADTLALDGQPLVEVARRTTVGDSLVLELGEVLGDWPEGKVVSDVCVFLGDGLAKEDAAGIAIVALGEAHNWDVVSSEKCVAAGGVYLGDGVIDEDVTMTLTGEKGNDDDDGPRFIWGQVYYSVAPVDGGLCVIDNVDI